MRFPVSRFSGRFAARLLAALRQGLARLPHAVRARGLCGVILAAACAPVGGAAWGGEYAKVYAISEPSTAQNGGALGTAVLVNGGLLRVNKDLSVVGNYAITIGPYNNVNVNGVTVAVASNATVSGTRALQLHHINNHPNCSINIAGTMTATTEYTLMDSQKTAQGSDHTVFNFLNGADIRTTTNSTAIKGIQTKNAAFMTFGYAAGTNGNTLGDAVDVAYGTGSATGALTKVDNGAVINIGVPITKDGTTASWTAYAAAGTTNLFFGKAVGNTVKSVIQNLYVGAAGFADAVLIDAADSAPTATAVTAVAGAKATVNFGKDGQASVYKATIDHLTINSGGTVNLTNNAQVTVNNALNLDGGTANVLGGTILVDGTLKFAGDTAAKGVLTIDNKAGGNNVNNYITTLTVAEGKYGTLKGDITKFKEANNLQTVTVNSGGTLRYGMTNETAPKIVTLNLNGTLTNQRAADKAALAVTTLNVAAGEDAALNGTGKTTVATPTIAGDLAIDGVDVAFTGAVAGAGGVAVKNAATLTTVGGALGSLALADGTLTNSTAALALDALESRGASAVGGAGAVNVAALAVATGELSFDNPGAIAAADVANAATLVLKDGSLAAATVAGTLDYRVTGATDLELAGGTAKVAAGQTLTAATATGFGTLAGPGDVAVTTLTAQGGTLTKSAPGAVDNAIADGGTLNLYGGTVGTAAVQNGGALNYKLAAGALTLTALDGALNNARGAELTVSGLGLVDGAASVSGGPVRFADAITVTGSLDLDAKTKFASGLTVNGGVLGVNFDAAAAPAVTVTGTADFSGGGKVRVAARGGAGGSAYAVLTADSLVGLDLANASVTGSTAMLRYALRIDPGALMLLCERKSYTEYATNPSDWEMASVLDEIAAAPGLAAGMDDVLSVLDAMGTAREVSRALSELNYGPAASASSAVARLSWRGFDDLLSARLSREAVLLAARRTLLPRLAPEGVPGPESDADAARAAAGGKPAATGLEAMWRPAREWRGFLQMDGGFGAEASAPGGAVGYDHRGLGLLAGLERRFGDELALGGLIGWTTNHADLYQSRGEARDDVLRLGGYGAWRWDGFFGAVAPTVGCHMLETRRHIGFLGRTARGERTGLDFHLMAQAGYVWELPRDFLVTPEATLAMTYLHDPAYQETGAGGARLRVADRDDWSLTQNLRLTVGKALRLRDGLALLPEVWGGWEHEYGTSNDVSCAFAVAPGLRWRAPVADLAADRGVVGAGVHALFSERLDLYGRYELKLWDGGCFNRFTLGAGLKF